MEQIHLLAIIFILITNWGDLCICQDEELPTLLDPFPSDIEPEPDPVTCPAECSSGFENSLQRLNIAEGKINNINDGTSSKLDSLGDSGGGGAGSGTDEGGSAPLDYSTQVAAVQDHLVNNMTVCSNKLSNDLDSLTTDVNKRIEDTKAELNGQLERHINSGGHGTGENNGEGGGDAAVDPAVIYDNITSSLDQLEFKKLQTLMDAHNVWRKNFEVVNKTFSKMTKSSYSNNVVVTG